MTEKVLDKQYFEIMDPPAIDGLAFRKYRGEADHQEMVDLENASHLFDKVDEQETLEQFNHNYKHLSNCDPDKDIIITEIDGQMVAFGRVRWKDIHDEGRAHYTFGVIHPDRRRQGIGTALLKHNMARIAAIAAEDDYEGKRFMDTWYADTQTGTDALLKKAGFEAERYFYEMTRDLSKPIEDHPMPEGVETRPSTKEHFRQVWDGMDEAFRDHWGHEEKTEADFVRWSEWPDHKPELWMVGWDGGEVTGMVLNEVYEKENKVLKRKWGWTDPICVRRPWRKRGLAKALITKSLHMFKDMGMEYAALGVDTKNPLGAMQLYSGLGYEVIKEWVVVRKAMN